MSYRLPTKEERRIQREYVVAALRDLAARIESGEIEHWDFSEGTPVRPGYGVLDYTGRHVLTVEFTDPELK